MEEVSESSEVRLSKAKEGLGQQDRSLGTDESRALREMLGAESLGASGLFAFRLGLDQGPLIQVCMGRRTADPATCCLLF